MNSVFPTFLNGEDVLFLQVSVHARRRMGLFYRFIRWLFRVYGSETKAVTQSFYKQYQGILTKVFTAPGPRSFSGLIEVQSTLESYCEDVIFEAD